MIRFFLAILAVTFTFLPGSVAQETAVENALLWKISGKDLPNTSYLYGTIHMIDSDAFFMTDEMKQAFKEAELVTFEINLEEMDNMFAQFSLLMQAFMDDNITLSDLLSEEDYQLVNDHFNKIGLPLSLFERMKPMFLSVMASTDSSPNALNSGEVVSYELEFMKMAKEQNKQMGGLETAAYQMSMFDSIPYKVQAEMLVESIKSGGEEMDELDVMTTLYRSQNIQGMQTLISDEDSDYAAYEELLLINRNKNWIPIMSEMMKDKICFFAVGAGHLGGPMGVVNLLREQGYLVEPIPFTVE